MSDYSKPLPLLEPGAEPLWESLKAHLMQIQRCSACGRFRYPPKGNCPHCLAPEHEWVPISGRGKVWAGLTVHQGAGAFAGDVPYNVSIIELDEGVRVVSNVVDCPPAAVQVGQAVELVYDDVTPECTLPRFRRVEQG